MLEQSEHERERRAIDRKQAKAGLSAIEWHTYACDGRMVDAAGDVCKSECLSIRLLENV